MTPAFMLFCLNLESVISHNIRILRNAPLTELSGILGYLCVFLPLLTAMGLRESIDLSSTMVLFGLANILMGASYGVPLVPQPMEVIAAVSISEGTSKGATATAGLLVSFTILVLMSTGITHWVHRIVPISAVRGIQVGVGFNLAISAGSLMVQPLGWHNPGFDNKTWAVGAAISYLAVAAIRPRFPWGIILYLSGLAVAAMQTAVSMHQIFRPWQPQLVVKPSITEFLSTLSTAVPQLPVSIFNIVSTSASLSTSLFPRYPTHPNSTSIGWSVACLNLLGCWLGAMPMCYAPWYSAGEHQSSACGGASIAFLGGITLLLGLSIGTTLSVVIRCFPASILGIMLLATGINVAKVGQHASDFAKAQSYTIYCRAEDGEDLWKRQVDHERSVMLITATGCLAFQNNALGLVVGLCWYHGSLSARYPRRSQGGGIDGSEQ